MLHQWNRQLLWLLLYISFKNLASNFCITTPSPWKSKIKKIFFLNLFSETRISTTVIKKVFEFFDILGKKSISTKQLMNKSIHYPSFLSLEYCKEKISSSSSILSTWVSLFSFLLHTFAWNYRTMTLIIHYTPIVIYLDVHRILYLLCLPARPFLLSKENLHIRSLFSQSFMWTQSNWYDFSIPLLATVSFLVYTFLT